LFVKRLLGFNKLFSVEVLKDFAWMGAHYSPSPPFALQFGGLRSGTVTLISWEFFQ
jgi:hypothetical protein